MRRALAILLLLALGAPVQAQEETLGEVRGKVLVGGPKGRGAAGLEVTLTHLAMAPMPPRSTVTDATGDFRFQDLPMGPSHGYIASVEYQGETWESAFLRALSGETVLTGDVVVFRLTTSDGAVSIARIRDVVAAEPGAFQVLEFLGLENSGDLAVAPEGGIRIPVPQGAQDLAFLEQDLSDTVVLGNGELLITAPLLPGNTELVYMYRIPYTGTAYQWEVRLAYPTAAVHLLVQDSGAQVETTGLTFQGLVELTSGESYLLWSGVAMEAGERLSVEFQGLPSFPEATTSAPTTQLDAGDPQRWLRGLGLLLAPMGAAAAYLYAVYRGRYPPAIEGMERPLDARQRNRQTLLRRIASLDEAFAAGKIPARRYRRERRHAKAKLSPLMGDPESREADSAEGSPGG